MIKRISSVLVVALLLSACKGDEESVQMTPQQSAAVQDASIADAYFNDASDMAASVMSKPSNDQFSGGRMNGTVPITIESDTRMVRAQVTLVTSSKSTALVPEGTITIDFGAGVGDGNALRKGIIRVFYHGWRFLKDSYYIVSFQDYSVAGIAVEGIRKVTTTSVSGTTVTFNVEDTNGRFIFSDGTTITRQSVHTRTWARATNSQNDTQWQVDGSAVGTTRDGKSYTFSVTRTLIFKMSCMMNRNYIATEGEAILTVDTLPIALDFGLNAGPIGCDDTVTVTVLGVTTDITVKYGK